MLIEYKYADNIYDNEYRSGAYDGVKDRAWKLGHEQQFSSKCITTYQKWTKQILTRIR